MSSHDDVPIVVDTVILLYFALTDQLQLLDDLAPGGLATTPVVFDPDEAVPHPPSVDEDTLCEIGRSRHFYTLESSDPRSTLEDQQQAQLAVARLSKVATLYGTGRLTVVDLTETEFSTFTSLATRHLAQEVGLRRAIDEGDASCVAVAIERSWTLGTDDADGLSALELLAPGHDYERIRKLLIRAGQQELITEASANQIHAEMRAWGFWDNVEPFPQ